METACDHRDIHILILTLPDLGVQAGYWSGREFITQRDLFSFVHCTRLMMLAL